MESNEEKFRQFKEKIDKEMEERRAYNKLIEKSITLSICGAFFRHNSLRRLAHSYLQLLLLLLRFEENLERSCLFLRHYLRCRSCFAIYLCYYFIIERRNKSGFNALEIALQNCLPRLSA